MKFLYKSICILLCLFIFCCSSVFATDIDTNSANDLTNTSISIFNDTINNASSEYNQNTTAKVSTTSTSEDFELSVSDIINIILISVGVVLILLAIAILIKIH